MPDGPIIIDDGGSMRIKQLPPATKKMDSLLDTKRDSPEGKFTLMRIVFFDKDGTRFAKPDINLDNDDGFVVSAGNGQTLTGDVSHAGKRVDLELDGVSDPIVEAKHNNNQRRYVVSNAGRIEKIEFRDASAGTNVAKFDVSVAGSDEENSVYTMIILKP